MMRHLSRRREVSPPPPPTRLLSWLAVAVLVHSALLLRSAVLTEGARAGPSSVFLDLAPLAMPPAASGRRSGARSRGVGDELVGDDKRRVPTGANPLHNR
ncbi:hypothetical protein ACMD2_16263 [Ananas comosus]|uniref:Uncharacterized protein n=1 Tax=Ananas comosus TaxID=4615 RepID=A0A199UW37_ANACO|nr:hypothetical protein ACMD2_16263 [Ananas comosus]